MLNENLRLFLQIAEKGSMVAAGREMGLSPTTVSERLAALEAHYGAVLFNRTTRSLNPTDEGRMLIEGAQVILAEVDELHARIRHGASTLSGPIKISAPVDLGRRFVATIIEKFSEQNPAITTELSVSDGYVDIVREGFDIALRFGAISDTSLRARSLGSFKRIVCAAPEYLEQHGVPKQPNDLQNHNCLVMRFGLTLDNIWRFQNQAKPMQVMVRGNSIVNDGYLIRLLALKGKGIILKSELDVAEDLKRGTLVALLQDYEAPAKPLQILFPPARAQPRRVKALADALTEQFSKLHLSKLHLNE